MKVLFDVNMPRPLRRELPGHEVITAQTMGWGELENGDLIDAGEKAGRARMKAPQSFPYQEARATSRSDAGPKST